MHARSAAVRDRSGAGTSARRADPWWPPLPRGRLPALASRGGLTPGSTGRNDGMPAARCLGIPTRHLVPAHWWHAAVAVGVSGTLCDAVECQGKL